jgi:cellobiose transport system substrate-binding protein
MRTAFRRTAFAAVAGLLLAGPALAGCSSSSTPQAADETGPITLTVNLFGDFGYKDLYAKYHETHPNITIKENVADYNAHHKNALAHLVAGSGLADIEAIEIGQIAGFIPHAAKFVNFKDYGVTGDQWTAQRTKTGSSADGKILFGVSTDTGGLALCYRPSLMKKAGLPDDPAALSAKLGTWDDYINVGKEFQAKIGDKNVHWFDAASNVFNAIAAQAPQGSYDESGNVITDKNPAVKAAWDTTVKGILAGESASLGAFTPEWNTGFQKGGFATITCPAWMMSYIKSNAKDTAGDWNIAKIPGTGGGNWGGSYLTVPKVGKHTKAAVDLAKWLTDPEQETWLFTNKGNLPADKDLWTKPEITGFKDPFFSNAPVGQIFTDAASKLQFQPLGAHAGEIGNAIGNGLVSVEQGKATSDAAWAKALADVKNLTG